ncbi:hypothetical protein [Streptomyces sp. ITFR-16]|uniref:hypothetical protein n=1 Tax=Streptomyces sp. ITFR-16 TaxID=3075198 RepID=UPI00288B4AF3|nr:hypothetical protein [Streptomyces sp. ITFR-16]WNI24189.1 hypothetical protein RLT58_20765 [Streptomyces sp. ITFR-16]
MVDQRGRGNEMSGGHVNGAVIQAGAVHGDVSVTAPVHETVNTVIREVRTMRFGPALYRVLASLAGCSAVYGAAHGDKPLLGAAAACEALGIPSGWTAPAAAWIAGRTDFLGGLATLLVLVGLLTVPKPEALGGDLAETLQWRGPSSTVLGLAVLAQCGLIWQPLLNIAPFVAFGIWVAGRQEEYGSRSGRVAVAVLGVLLALAFAPLYAFLWLFGRDANRAA